MEAIILVACQTVVCAGVAHKGAVVGAKMCDLAVGFVAQVGRVVTSSAASVQGIGKRQR